MIGQIILNYKILSVLGEGGMGTVYLAEHSVLNKKSAVKVLHPQYINNPQIRERFKNESILLSKLKHPNIVGVYDFYEDEKGLFIFMEYFEGTPLDEYIAEKSGPIASERAIPIMKKVLDGFAYAHSQGVIHRDIKPSNIMIDDSDNIKILDFGIAKIIDEDKSLTKTGQMGTVFYMSPEQVNGVKVSEKSDIYSLGVTFYQILTGMNPYGDLTTEFEVMNKIVKDPLPNPQTIYPGIPDFLCTILTKTLQKDPANRFSSCREFITALDDKTMIEPININSESKNNPKKKNSKKTIIIASLVGLLLITSVLFFLLIGLKNNKEVIKINFISNYPIAKQNSNLPNEVKVFAKVFGEIENDKFYFPVLSFKRLDADYLTDTIPFSRSVYDDIDFNEAENMYLSERESILSLYSMYAKSNLVENKSINESVNNVKHFYLNKSTNGKFDGKVNFNDENQLLNYITSQLKRGTLFSAGQKQNTINIILLREEKKVPKPEEKITDPDPVPPIEDEINVPIPEPVEVEKPKSKVKTYDANLNSNGNQISWSQDLLNAQKLVISFKSLADGSILVSEDVTNQTSFYFTYSNSIYTDSEIRIELKASFSDNSKIKNQYLTVTDLVCH